MLVAELAREFAWHMSNYVKPFVYKKILKIEEEIAIACKKEKTNFESNFVVCDCIMYVKEKKNILQLTLAFDFKVPHEFNKLFMNMRSFEYFTIFLKLV